MTLLGRETGTDWIIGGFSVEWRALLGPWLVGIRAEESSIVACEMSRSLGDVQRLVLAVTAVCAATFWLWPYVGPTVSVVMAIFAVVLAANLPWLTRSAMRAFRARRSRADAAGKGDVRPRSNGDSSTPPDRRS